MPEGVSSWENAGVCICKSLCHKPFTDVSPNLCWGLTSEPGLNLCLGHKLLVEKSSAKISGANTVALPYAYSNVNVWWNYINLLYKRFFFLSEFLVFSMFQCNPGLEEMCLSDLSKRLKMFFTDLQKRLCVTESLFWKKGKIWLALKMWINCENEVQTRHLR